MKLGVLPSQVTRTGLKPRGMVAPELCPREGTCPPALPGAPSAVNRSLKRSQGKCRDYSSVAL